MERRWQLARLISASVVAFAIPFAVAAAFLITLLVPFGQTATAHNRHELSALGYGYPLAWVHQDQREFTSPSYPTSDTWGSPEELPTSVEPDHFLADWAIFASVLFVVLVLAAGLIRTVGGIRAPTAMSDLVASE